MKNLFYVVEKQLKDVGEVEETTGWKNIIVYSIVENQPKIFCEIEALTENSSVEEIQEYLDNNGYGDEEFEFTQL